MEEKDKQLLLVDLCGRLPYNVQIHGIFTDIDYSKDEDEDGFIFENEYDTYLSIETFDWFIHGSAKIKPYLRPMSSMTDEEREEYRKFSFYGAAGIRDNDFTEMVAAPSFEKMDFLNSHHFDYRGLIEKGLALKAPEGMYN